ncbi:MAG TPA: redoxin domain-containing protein, partial [Rhizobiales bacterium]|nr:redoxin domain-containing protein [Hyphomicrobiales bacterium]
MARLIRFLVISLLLVSKADAAPIEPLSLMLDAAPIQGKQVSLNDLKDRPVVVTFFASWCPPCTAEFKALNVIRKDFPASQLTIVAVNLFEAWGGKRNPARMKRFLKRTEPEFFVIKGNEAIRRAFGNIERIPTLVVYNRQGNEVWRFVHKQGATKMSA